MKRLLLVAAAGLLVHRRLAGSWPLVDLCDEEGLRRAAFADLAQRYLTNPRRSDVVVSLTTIPSRLDRLDLTLKSLFRQVRRPAEIRLNLPAYSEREGRPYRVPAWLDTPAVTLVRTPDHGPATKLIPSLDLPPRQRVLVVDDDRVYGPRLVEELHAHADRWPDHILCCSGWRVPADLTDRPTTLRAVVTRQPHVPVLGSNVRRPVAVDIVQGLNGYLVQPRMFDRAALVDFSGAPPQARYCDDVWISAHAQAPRVVVPLSRISYTPRRDRSWHRATSLARNFNYKPDVEQRSNTVMLRWLRDRWGRSVGSPGGP